MGLLFFDLHPIWLLFPHHHKWTPLSRRQYWAFQAGPRVRLHYSCVQKLRHLGQNPLLFSSQALLARQLLSYGCLLFPLFFLRQGPYDALYLLQQLFS